MARYIIKNRLTDAEDVKPTVFLDAMGQAFFSLTIGMGCMITYGSYFNNRTNLTKTAIQVSVLDTLVAILAGVIIFPSAFFNLPDITSATFMLPAGGFFICLFVGWYLDKKLVHDLSMD